MRMPSSPRPAGSVNSAGSMLLPSEIRERCRRHIERHLRLFIADATPDSASSIDFSAPTPVPAPERTVTVGLKPPNQKEAVEDLEAVRQFVASWQGYPGVEWGQRRWNRVGLGTQELPVRITLVGDEIVEVAGATEEIHRLREAARLLAQVSPDPTFRAHVEATVKQWRRADINPLVRVCRWALENPYDDVPFRQWDVPGVDTKWIERNTRAVRALVNIPAAARPSVRVSVRLLDPELQPEGGRLPQYLRDINVPLADAARMFPEPVRVIVVENQLPFQLLPQAKPGSRVVAVWGSGYQAPALVAGLPWCREALLWSDLDADGFAIVNGIRAVLPDAPSICMDSETWDAFEKFSVESVTSGERGETLVASRAVNPDRILDRLTPAEQATYQRIGTLRLEQERLPVRHVLAEIARHWPDIFE
ncbi:hypothetical protein CFAL_05040 [Corynebacterium falsenii DSM 44353]|nr:hypothetical protein CFAL_05040 [Corynebacterium falsenii DSM 44353]